MNFKQYLQEDAGAIVGDKDVTDWYYLLSVIKTTGKGFDAIAKNKTYMEKYQRIIKLLYGKYWKELEAERIPKKRIENMTDDFKNLMVEWASEVIGNVAVPVMKKFWNDLTPQVKEKMKIPRKIAPTK